jgi:hypothetical protein
MSKEKQIEEMAQVVRDTIYQENENGFTEGFDALCTATEYLAEKITEALYTAGYRKQEWISVEERLPKNYRPVLVACEGLTIGGYAPIAIGSYGGGLWSLADADGTAYLTKYMRCTVTHWMPLPEPPKGE